MPLNSATQTRSLIQYMDPMRYYPAVPNVALPPLYPQLVPLLWFMPVIARAVPSHVQPPPKLTRQDAVRPKALPDYYPLPDLPRVSDETAALETVSAVGPVVGPLMPRLRDELSWIDDLPPIDDTLPTEYPDWFEPGTLAPPELKRQIADMNNPHDELITEFIEAHAERNPVSFST